MAVSLEAQYGGGVADVTEKRFCERQLAAGVENELCRKRYDRYHDVVTKPTTAKKMAYNWKHGRGAFSARNAGWES